MERSALRVEESKRKTNNASIISVYIYTTHILLVRIVVVAQFVWCFCYTAAVWFVYGVVKYCCTQSSIRKLRFGQSGAMYEKHAVAAAYVRNICP